MLKTGGPQPIPLWKGTASAGVVLSQASLSSSSATAQPPVSLDGSTQQLTSCH